MLIRAGASNREMVGALGVNIKLLSTLVFGLGAALAGLAGLMQAPILSVQTGMGETILILAFVVIVIGGIGSIRGAFLAALIVGLVDTIGRAFLPICCASVLSAAAASAAAPAIASMLIYLLMAVVLVVRPAGPVPGAPRMTDWLTLARIVVVARLLCWPPLVPVYAALDRPLPADAVHAHRDLGAWRRSA